MTTLGPIDSPAGRTMRGCAVQLREVSKAADTLASQVGALLAGSATGADRAMAASLRVLAREAYDAAAALELAQVGR